MRILKPLPGILPMPGKPLADVAALWLMNSLGNKVFDLSGNGRTGTLIADTKWVPGKFGAALDFDGTDDYVQWSVEDNPFNGGLTQLTAIIWCKFDDVGRSIFSCWYTGNLQILVRGDGTGLDTFLYVDGVQCGGDFTDLTINTTDWYMITVVWDGANIYMYRDTTKSTISFACTGILNSVTAADKYFYIGKYAANLYNGLISSFSIYNRALSASEIAELSQEPFCMFPENIMPEFGIVA